MAAKDELTLIKLNGPGLGKIPGLELVWNDALDRIGDVHDRQDAGILDAKGSVELTIKLTFSRKSVGATAMDVSHTMSMKTPSYAASGCTAHKHGKDWSFVDAEQPALPGITPIRARDNGSN